MDVEAEMPALPEGAEIGMEIADTGNFATEWLQGCSPRTVARHWDFARHWLKKRFAGEERPSDR